MSSNTLLKLGDLAISDEDRSKRKPLHFLRESSLGKGPTDSIEYALGMQRGDIDKVPCDLPAKAMVSELLEKGYALGNWALLPDMPESQLEDMLDLLATNYQVPFNQRQYLPHIIHKPGTSYTYTLLFWPHIVDIRGPNDERCISGSQRITSEIHPVCALTGLAVFLSYTKREDSLILREKLRQLGPFITQDLLKRIPDLCRTVVPEFLACVMGPIPSLFFKARPDYRDNKSSEVAERRETLEATIAEKKKRIKALKAELKRAEEELTTDFLPRELESLMFMMREEVAGHYAHILNHPIKY